MFTGLIEDVGSVLQVSPLGAGRRLVIQTAMPTAEIAIGDSIAVNGVCLTAETVEPGRFSVTAGLETLERTTTGALRPGASVNLERALQLGARLGGHLVQGHVDGVGAVSAVTPAQESLVLWVTAPADLGRYIAEKGSVCIDGISLTVNELRGADFRVNIIPHTAAVTGIDKLRVGSQVNLEVDLLARYVERLLQGERSSLSLERLEALGYGRKR